MPAIQSVLYQKTIPFSIHNTHMSANRLLQPYKKATGWTIPAVRYDSPPNEGKVILNIIKHGCSKQVSVHPRHLFPWEPIVGGEVVVVKGAWFGITSVAKVKTGNNWIITFSVDNDTQDFVFEEKDLTALDATR